MSEDIDDTYREELDSLERMGALYSALAKAQAEMGHAKKDKTNPFFKSAYADLAAVTDACRPALAKNGLCVYQTTEDGPDGLYLVTRLGHSSGACVMGRMAIKPTKADPQGIGSALTYARRYALAAITGVATEDDDGNDASAKDDRPVIIVPKCPKCNTSLKVVQAIKNPSAGAWGCTACLHQFDVQD